MFTQCLKRVNLSSKPNILMKRRGVSFFSVLILEKLIKFLFRALEETSALFYGLNRKEEEWLYLIMHEFLSTTDSAILKFCQEMNTRLFWRWKILMVLKTTVSQVYASRIYFFVSLSIDTNFFSYIDILCWLELCVLWNVMINNHMFYNLSQLQNWRGNEDFKT